MLPKHSLINPEIADFDDDDNDVDDCIVQHDLLHVEHHRRHLLREEEEGARGGDQEPPGKWPRRTQHRAHSADEVGLEIGIHRALILKLLWSHIRYHIYSDGNNFAAIFTSL